MSLARLPDMVAVHGFETAPRRGTTLVMQRSLDG
jgi:hypothetical protein